MHRPVLAEVATINARLAPASTPLSSRGDLRQRGPVFPGVRNAGIDTRGPATPRSGFATARPGITACFAREIQSTLLEVGVDASLRPTQQTRCRAAASNCPLIVNFFSQEQR